MAGVNGALLSKEDVYENDVRTIPGYPDGDHGRELRKRLPRSKVQAEPKFKR